MNAVIKRLGIDRKEFDKLFLLILHTFFSSIFASVYFSVANAEFVNNFGSDFLPFGYLLSGIIGYFAVQGYGHLLKKSSYSAFVGGQVFLLVAVVLFRTVLFFTTPEGTKWTSFVVFLFAMPFVAISGLKQSGLLLKVYNIREGKKYSGIINVGGTAASIIGYLSIPLLIPFLGSRFDLFFVAIIGISVALLFLFKLNKLLNLSEQKETIASNIARTNISLSVLLRQKYIRYIAICGGISMMAFYFIDYSFLVNAKATARTPAELSAIIGGFFAFIKVAEMILSLLSGRIFRSFGLKIGIIILPAICVCVSFCAVGIYNFSDAGTFISLVFVLKFFERCIGKAIEEPTFKNLYQLLGDRDRLSIQAKIDGGTKQLFIILASAILLLYAHFMPSPYLKIGLLGISIPIFLFWLFSASQLVKSFKEKLRDILKPENSDGNIDAVTPFEKIRALVLNARQTANSGGTILELLSYKIILPAEKQKPLAVPQLPARHESFMPHPFFNYLVAAKGHSRFELQLYQPLLVIPPKEIKTEITATKNFEGHDEKEILNLAFAPGQPDKNTIKTLGKKLDDLKHDHEKKLVLNILGRSDEPLAVDILLNHIDYPDYYTRKQVFKTLETKNFKYSQKEEIFYRSSLDSTLSEITYIISALNSIPHSDEFSDLLSALLEEESILKNRLLSILTWKYDKASISVIRENIFSGNSDSKNTNNILALELIDNLVEGEIKPRIMAVFEAGSYSWRLSALNKWYHFPTLNLKETLVNILNYDYTRIGLWTKACTLKIILNEKNKEHRAVIAGFSYHPALILRLLAYEYCEELNGNLIYPLLPKEDLFSTSNNSNKFNNLKGTEIYNYLKLLKSNNFFRKTSLNDLIKFSLTTERKNNNDVRELAAKGNTNNKPVFITEGNLILEFKKKFPAETFSKNYIFPSMFDNDQLSKVLIRPRASVYEVSPVHLVDLLLTSDSLLNDLTQIMR